MSRLARFVSLPRVDRALLVRAAVLLAAIRVGLRLLPFQTLRRLLYRYPSAGIPTRVRADSSVSVDRVAWAVGVASLYVPGARTCLPRALATQVLLEREGLPAHLRVGVVRGETGQLLGHAWVESRGDAVIGGSDLERYTLLGEWEGRRP